MQISAPSRDREPDTAGGLRRALLAIFILGVVGTAAELLLVGHTEDPWQWVPLGMFGISLLVLGWVRVAASAASLQAN